MSVYLPKALIFLFPRASTRVLFWPGYKNEMRVVSGLNKFTSLSTGGLTFRTKSKNRKVIRRIIIINVNFHFAFNTFTVA